MKPVELIATAAPGVRVDLLQVNSNGTQQPFSVTASNPFTLTDISIQQETVVPGPTLFAVDITQTVESGGDENRWAFVGSISQNVERSFTTGMVFSTPFVIQNLIEDPSAPAAIVRPWGFTN